jgi:SAM-dependent methyltransferase
MPLGTFQALRLLHRTFHHHPPAQRLHILGRFLTAPFLRTLDMIPSGARVLDIGAGHGTWARLIAETRGANVVALEPDLRKTLAAYKHPNIRFVAGFDDCIRGSFDVVVLYDVLYRIPPVQRDALFSRIHDRVKPGGTFVLKDIDPSRRVRYHWNKLQERIADKIGLSLGQQFDSDSIETIADRLTRSGFTGVQWKRIDFGYPHAHILYTARRA